MHECFADQLTQCPIRKRNTKKYITTEDTQSSHVHNKSLVQCCAAQSDLGSWAAI